MRQDQKFFNPVDGIPTFEPSPWLLEKMIEQAMAKSAAHREKVLRDRAERAWAIGRQRDRERREHNARRYVYVGDTP